MSNSNELKRLQEDMKANDELRLNFEKLIHDKGLKKSCESDADLFIQAAEHFGYKITLGDLERDKAEKEILDVAELDQVAGGKKYDTTPICWKDYLCGFCYTTGDEDEGGHNAGLCATVWYCYVVTMHNDSDRNDHACWSDYECAYVYQ